MLGGASETKECIPPMNDLTAQRPIVTRVEVIDTIASAFDRAPLTRGDLIRAAEHAAARPPLVELLERLPERAYRRPADMWDELPDVPIEH